MRAALVIQLLSRPGRPGDPIGTMPPRRGGASSRRSRRYQSYVVGCPSSRVIAGAHPRAFIRPTSRSFRGVPSGLTRVPDDLTLVADDPLDDRRPARRIVWSSPVPTLTSPSGTPAGVHVLQSEDDGVAEVVDVQELPTRRSRTPERTGRVAGLRLVELAHHRGQHVAGREVEVVARPVQVRGHERQVVGAVFAVEAAAKLDAGDLGQRVGAIGLFERAGEEVLLLQRLRRELRVDARATEEEQSFHVGAECRIDRRSARWRGSPG